MPDLAAALVRDAMQLFPRRSADPATVYRAVLFDQLQIFLKPVPGEEVILEMVCPVHHSHGVSRQPCCGATLQ
jgi:hypothetical protein